MQGFEEQLAKFFQEKLPSLPDNARETLSKLLPWLFIVFGILGLVAWLAAIGLFSAATIAIMGMGHAGAHLSIFAILLMYILAPVMQVLSITAGYLMLSRQVKGWRIGFYSLLLSFIVHLAYFSLLGIFWDLVFVYLLFQVRDYYTV